MIRGGSWPVQNFGGEFRYNLVIDSGHNFWRGATDHAQIHHNVFAHAQGVNTGYSGAILVFGGVAGLNVYNNTFDLAGNTGSFDAPAFTIASGSLFNSIRNNLFTNFVDVSPVYARAFVSYDDAIASPRVSSADYNAFYNPLAPITVRYRAGIVATTPGQHDVQANPQLSGDSEVPYRISEGCVWTGACTVGQVLGHYRNVYRPAPGSPLIDAGDPADGAGTAIGAVGPDDGNPIDLFGRLIAVPPPPPDTQPPTVTLTAPSPGSTVSGMTTISATAFDNIGVAGVKFLIDGTQTGSEQTGMPYAVAWNTSTATNGSHTLAAIARDAAGNTTTSAAVTVTVSNVAPPPPPPPPPGGLVAAYGFEEGTGTTTANAAGAGLTGTLSNATWQTAGKFGKALQFTGGNASWVTVPDSAALRLTTGMTVSAWVRPTTALQAEPTVVFKERSGSLAYGLYANSGDSQPIVWYTSGGAFNFMSLGAGNAVPINAWTYLTATFDGATLRMYINGQLVGSQATSAPIDATTGVLRIGGNSIWSGEGFPGLIDEVRLYNRALSQAEIQTDMKTPVVTP